MLHLITGIIALITATILISVFIVSFVAGMTALTDIARSLETLIQQQKEN